MKLQDVIDEIKIKILACGILESDLNDAQLKSIVQLAIRELERYWDETTRVTVPFASCIDLKGFDHLSIVKVYRAAALGGGVQDINVMSDPLVAQQYTLYSNIGTMYNLQDAIYNFAAWNTMTQIRNTMGTELRFDEDRHNEKLYIHQGSSSSRITIEYIPKINSVEDIKSPYWQDNLVKLSIAWAKIIYGRLKTSWKQTNTLWENNGQALLDEGNEELKELQTMLAQNDSLCAPLD